MQQNGSTSTFTSIKNVKGSENLEFQTLNSIRTGELSVLTGFIGV